ncbi:MAG TPA: hypothetical protein V6C65_40845, partial [Allocoleopsis sp.]
MNLEESQILYCGNDLCDDEATHVIKETQMPLCWCCANAYRLGSSNQHSLLAIDEKDEDSPFFVKTCSNCGTERDGLINCEQCDHVEPEVQQLIDRSA